MDLYDYQDSTGFELIPEGTVLEVMIGNVNVGLSKSGTGNTVLHFEAQVSSGPYMYQKLNHNIVIKSSDPEKDKSSIGRSIKRMMEYANNASSSNRLGYIVPEVSDSSGRLVPNWKFLEGKVVGIKTKIEPYTRSDGTEGNSHKIGEFASKNPESGGYRIWAAIEKNEQPWQKPLPARKGVNQNIPAANGFDDDIPFIG